MTTFIRKAQEVFTIKFSTFNYISMQGTLTLYTMITSEIRKAYMTCPYTDLHPTVGLIRVQFFAESVNTMISKKLYQSIYRIFKLKITIAENLINWAFLFYKQNIITFSRFISSSFKDSCLFMPNRHLNGVPFFLQNTLKSNISILIVNSFRKCNINKK